MDIWCINSVFPLSYMNAKSNSFFLVDEELLFWKIFHSDENSGRHVTFLVDVFP